MKRHPFTGLKNHTYVRRCRRADCAKRFETESRIQLYCSRECKDIVKSEEAKAARQRAKQ